MTREELAVVSFLVRYAPTTQEAYGLRLRLFVGWLDSHGLGLFEAERVHIELYGRHLTVDRGNAPSSVAHALRTLRSFYRSCEADGVIGKSPATHVVIPKSYRDEERATYLNRTEMCDFLEAAKRLGPKFAAITVLLGVLGLRASEAAAVRIEDIRESDAGYSVLRLVGKGGKPASIPIPVSIMRVLDAHIAGRTSGPMFPSADGSPIGRHAIRFAVKRIAAHSRVAKSVHPHSLRRSMVTNALNAGASIREVQAAARHSDPRTTSRYDRGAGSLDSHAVHTLAAYIAGAM